MPRTAARQWNSSKIGVYAFDIILDIQMPVMDGYSAAREIRKLAPDLPVIALTAHALQEERARCLAAGMVEHLAKPIDQEQLLGAIRRQLPAKQTLHALVNGEQGVAV